MFRVEFGELPGIFEDAGRVRSVERYWAECERREALDQSAFECEVVFIVPGTFVSRGPMILIMFMVL